MCLRVADMNNCNNVYPQPASYAAILTDEDEDPEEGSIMVEDQLVFHEIEGLTIYEGEDGHLYYSETEAEEVFAAAQSMDLPTDIEDEDDEDHPRRRPTSQDIIPRFHIVAECGGIGRGERGARGGRGAGRGRGRVSRRGRARGGWMRGEPLVERFVSDEELPEQLRASIGRLLADQNRRERSVRERSAVRAGLDEGMNEGEVEEEEEEVFVDAEDFVWQPMDGWRGVKETFLRDDSGPTSVFTSAYDCFRAYWDDNILSHIVEETNRYALGLQSDRFHHDWYATNLDEIMILFAFWMMLGIIKMPSIRSCYSKMPILHTGVFRYLLSEGRYWNLNRSFHLATDSVDVNDPLHPMGPVLNHLNSKFQQLYKLHQDICIDESLTLWKGPLGFKQYIRTKAARFGIKTFQLCESSTGYLWNFFVYVGRSTLPSTLPLSFTHVKTLIQPLLNLGHTLYMDNWFNSPTLARYLKRHRTDCVGTLRPNRKHVPRVIRKAKLNTGEFIARQAGDMMVMGLQDPKRVHLLSTYHGPS